jgi:hypothetical protein
VDCGHFSSGQSREEEILSSVVVRRQGVIESLTRGGLITRQKILHPHKAGMVGREDGGQARNGCAVILWGLFETFAIGFYQFMISSFVFLAAIAALYVTMSVRPSVGCNQFQS